MTTQANEGIPVPSVRHPIDNWDVDALLLDHENPRLPVSQGPRSQDELRWRPRANSTELPAPKIIDFAKMSSACLICLAPDPDLLMMGIGSIGTGAERR